MNSVETTYDLVPGCGDGAIVYMIIIEKLFCGSTPQEALTTTFGVDENIENVIKTRTKILKGLTQKYDLSKPRDEWIQILANTIRWGDPLPYITTDEPLDELFSYGSNEAEMIMKCKKKKRVRSGLRKAMLSWRRSTRFSKVRKKREKESNRLAIEESGEEC